MMHLSACPERQRKSLDRRRVFDGNARIALLTASRRAVPEFVELLATVSARLT